MHESTVIVHIPLYQKLVLSFLNVWLHLLEDKILKLLFETLQVLQQFQVQLNNHLNDFDMLIFEDKLQPIRRGEQGLAVTQDELVWELSVYERLPWYNIACLG